jgi:alpha-glucosidase (family GH31 glycosyl hydrolase)
MGLVRAGLRVGFVLLALSGCDDEPYREAVVLSSAEASVRVILSPFSLVISEASGAPRLTTLSGGNGDPYGAPSASHDDPIFSAKSLPGWDGYIAQESPWRHVTRARVRDRSDSSLTLDLEGHGVQMTLGIELDGPRVRLHVSGVGPADAALDKTTIAFASSPDEHFFGMGERFATVDHRGWQLYNYAEEGALGKGENAPVSEQNPYPNGPSMTYFPVPFFLSSHGYAVHLDTTYRSEVSFASDRDDAWRLAVNADHFDATVYVHDDPLSSIDDYTADTGRPLVPAPWVFGNRRRVGVNAEVGGVPEWQAMRDADVACTGIDDAVHFLPALSQTGREAELATWTKTLHAAGYKALAYNNPYVAENDPNAAADYAYGEEHGYFVKGPDGQPTLTEFISGKLLTIAAVDLTNPDAVSWYQSLLKRALDLGYDGWMHDFGEYTPRDAVFFDGRRGDELHDEYPVLSAKAAHDLMEQERPGDYLFFVRSGYSGTQAYVPAVWGGDAEATFDETQGLPSAVRGGVNLSMSGVPYWGSDMTGFKCITDFPHDKEIFLRWVELGAVSPIMMEQNACSNPLGAKTKWTLWSDQETIDVYARWARFHTRLAPYFAALALEASQSGRPITLHPFLLYPTSPEAWSVEDAFYLGRALYASPVVRRGATNKKTWLPAGRFVDLDDYSLLTGDAERTVSAPLDKLPLFLVAGEILPLLDQRIDTLAPASDPLVVTPADVADRLDAMVALGAGDHASLTLADGTVLEATHLANDAGNPSSLVEVVDSAISDCASCFVRDDKGAVARIRLNTAVTTGSDLTLGTVHVTSNGGPSRRVRWEVLLLP